MRQRLSWMLVLVAVAVLCVVSWSSRAQTSSKKTWEYKVISTYGVASMNAPPSLQALNEAGDEGWELVEIRSGDYPKAGSNQVRTDYFLKRIK